MPYRKKLDNATLNVYNLDVSEEKQISLTQVRDHRSRLHE